MPRTRSSGETGPSDGLEATCWICLGDATNTESGEMIQPCLCPRYAHQKCLARWQLQSAGKPYALTTLSNLPRKPRCVYHVDVYHGRLIPF